MERYRNVEILETESWRDRDTAFIEVWRHWRNIEVVRRRDGQTKSHRSKEIEKMEKPRERHRKRQIDRQREK